MDTKPLITASIDKMLPALKEKLEAAGYTDQLIEAESGVSRAIHIWVGKRREKHHGPDLSVEVSPSYLSGYSEIRTDKMFLVRLHKGKGPAIRFREMGKAIDRAVEYYGRAKVAVDAENEEKRKQTDGIKALKNALEKADVDLGKEDTFYEKGQFYPMLTVGCRMSTARVIINLDGTFRFQIEGLTAERIVALCKALQ